MRAHVAIAGRHSQSFLAVGLGLVVGGAYTLSPLTVGVLAALHPLWRLASRGLSDRERYWLGAALWLAIGLRFLAIGGLFLSADESQPFATFFGDEELFKSRSVWIRNLGMGVPISKADMIYLFDDVGQTSYLQLLAFVQALVGDAPYGMHMLNAMMYVCAAVGLYRIVRPAFGGVAAMGGLVLLLFLPSLIVWSVSALKEPLYTLVAAAEFVCTVMVARAPRPWQRMLAAAGVIVGAFALQGVRNGGLVVAGVGALGGLAVGLALARPRVLLAAVLVLPLATSLIVTRPTVERRLLEIARIGAFNHAGYLATPGRTYPLIDPVYYDNRFQVRSMSPDELARFATEAVVAYFVVPLPQHIDSGAIVAYLPEQFIWWVMLLLVPVGVLAGVRRDAVLTSLLAAHAAAVIVTVALNSGNIGTLIRHRGLAWPYLAWLAALGACDLLRRITAVAETAVTRMEPI